MISTIFKPTTKSLSFILTLIVAIAVSMNAKNQKGATSEKLVVLGQRVFQSKCNMCHFPDKADKKIGPGLKHLFKNPELPASHKPATEANVREQIAKGSPNAKPMPMPAFAGKLSSTQIDNLIAYLKTL